MIFIVDTNRIIAGLIRNSSSREILLNPNFEFYTPDFLLSEIKNHKDLIMKKGDLSESKFDTIYELLIDRINVLPKSDIMDHINCQRHSNFPQFRHLKIPHLYLYLTLRNLLCFWE